MVKKRQKLMAATFFVASANIACGGNVPYGLFGLGSVTDRLHIGNRWMAQSGFNTYDNTARMHYPLLPSFDVPDPLSQDYPSLSPYSHCAGNPLSLIDPTGMKIEFEYSSKEEEEFLQRNMTDILKQSDMFKTLYNMIENDKSFVLTVKFGETVRDKHGINVQAQYDVGSKTITFLKEKKLSIANQCISEEFYHAYQDFYATKNGITNEWNREFEAKVATSQIIGETPSPVPLFFEVANEYFNTIRWSALDSKIFSPETISTPTVLNDYITNGSVFSKNYKDNRHYSVPVTSIPDSFINLIRKSYAK